ncbi:hypothetical protein BD779DRAFT_1610156 [Infundibulicybe gibba]|nr:hypothetical protein BD779DRAFT_1610156 [Infundibulicybe gibba]
MPMNAAHQHAANAEEFYGKGLLVSAAEEHNKAAEAYKVAIERSHDESAKRTLRMLYNDHCKEEKELRRRIDQLTQDGQDPTLPQKQHTSVPSTSARMGPQVHPGIPRLVPSPPPQRPMMDTVDESFMLLGGQRSDPGDAFNQFWNIMQGMLDNLSQPVAFATVPLGNGEPIIPTPGVKTPPLAQRIPRRDGSTSSDTDIEEPMLSRFSRRIGIGRKSNSTMSNVSQTDEFDDEFLEDGDDLSESFCLIPGGAEMSPLALKRENTTLKAEVEAMRKRLEATERVLKIRKDQDVQLRDGIVQATREAQRVMGASLVVQRPGLDLSTLNTNIAAVPIPGINSGREAQYARRVRELEEEIRVVKVENEKHKAMIVKFRERWEKLKESAKRKKEAKAAADNVTSVRERIIEEPEAEEELDGANVIASV